MNRSCIGRTGRIAIAGAWLVTAGLALPPTAAAASNPAALLPDRILGYTSRGADGLYTAETLFDLIDGGAEVYRAFDVRTVLSRRYGREDAADVLVDLFDMGTASNAFGVYHHDTRDGPEAGIGRESEAAGAAVAFWKDRYFVSITALEDSAPAQQAVRALGRAVADRITAAGEPPAIVRALPEEGRDARRLTYFHDWTYLKTRVFLGEENLLRIGRDTEGALAPYRRGGPRPSSYLLMLVRYPSAGRAGEALAAFRAAYLGKADAQGVAQRSDGRWAAARLVDGMLLVVLEGTARPDIEEIMAAVERAGGG